MDSHIRQFLLIALFAAAQVLGAPLASAVGCRGEGQGAASCCCSVEGGAKGCGGCCSTGSEDERPGPSEPGLFDLGCHCVVSPPVPPPQSPGEGILAELESRGAPVFVETHPAHALAWPAVVTSMAARPPNRTPRVAWGTERVFTQVFRL